MQQPPAPAPQFPKLGEVWLLNVNPITPGDPHIAPSSADLKAANTFFGSLPGQVVCSLLLPLPGFLVQVPFTGRVLGVVVGIKDHYSIALAAQCIVGVTEVGIGILEHVIDVFVTGFH